MTKAEQEKTGLTGQDKSQDDLGGGERQLPEGLKRERTKALDKELGRINEKGAHDRAE